MPTTTILLGIVPPFLIALIILAIAWRPWSAQPARWALAASALALALAYAITESLIVRAWPGFPPAESHRWLPYAALIAAAGAALWPRQLPKRWSFHDLIALALLTFVGWRQLAATGSLAIYIPSLGAFAIPAPVIGALWILLSATMAGAMRSDAARLNPCVPRVPLTWIIAATAAAITYFQSSELLYAQLAGALATALFSAAAISLWRPNREVTAGLAPVFSLLYCGLILACQTTAISAIALFLAGSAHALAGWPIAAKLPPWLTTALCMLLAAALGVLAIWQSPGGFNFNPY